jgi:hypothetical protein
MARNKYKKKREMKEEPMSSADYYDLHPEAVEDLATANEENSPEVSEKELDQYRSGPKIRLSTTVKAILIKWWFAGMVCFFILWGLGAFLTDILTQFVVVGFVLGVVTDLLVNNIFRFFAKEEGEFDRFMMFPKKQFSTFFLNILYAYVLMFFVYTLYTVINAAAVKITGDQEHIFLGVEPILFGLFYLGFDMMCLGLKRLFFKILKDAKEKSK